MAMAAAALVAAPSIATLAGSARTIEQHARSRAICARRGSSWDFSPASGRGGPSTSECAADFGQPLSGGRDGGGGGGGACCGVGGPVVATTPGPRSRFNAGADRLGWRACSGGLLRLDLSGLSAASSAAQRKHVAAVPRRLPLRIVAEKPDLTNVAGTLLRIGKQGLEAGTKLVPESVPRPVAQAGVGLAGLFVASFLLRSLFSTVAFILAIGALSYAGYLFLTKGESNSSSDKSGEGSGKPKSADEALEEAGRIMDKYK